MCVCDDLFIDDGYSDSLFVEINVNNGKNLILGVIYQPPDSDINSFKNKLDELLNCINKTNKNCFILGDFNIDLENSVKNDFINALYASSFFPTINIYTRETESSKSVIDNIITNIHNNCFDSGVILSDITDHFPIVLFIDIAKKINEVPLKTKVKVLNEKNLMNLSENLRDKTWDSVYSCKSPDAAYNVLIEEITDSINSTIPEKITKCAVGDQKVWLTRGILKSVKKKNTLYKRYIQNSTDENKEEYTKHKNKLTHVIRISKRKHYSEEEGL